MVGGLIVQVLGEMSNNGGSWHKFSQTFFLAEQPQGYYVLNDIFRFLKEDIEPEYEGESEEVTSKFTFQDEKAQHHANGVEKKAPVKEAVKPVANHETKASTKPAAQAAPTNASQSDATHAAEKSPVKKESQQAPVVKQEQSQSAAPAKPANVKKEPAAPLAWSKVVTSNAAEPKPAPATVKVASQKAPKPVSKKEEDTDGFKEIGRNGQSRPRTEGNHELTIRQGQEHGVSSKHYRGNG